MTNPKKIPQVVRRRNTARITLIPVEGRKGPAPAWPLDTSTPAELKRWKALWALPHAEIWEMMSLDLVVALYTRVSLAAEQGGASTRLLAEARQMGDRLLLNPQAMFRAQIQMVDESGDQHSVVPTDIEIYRASLAGESA